MSSFVASWVHFIDGTGIDRGQGIASDSAWNVYCTDYVSTGSVTISGILYTKPSNAADYGAYIIKLSQNYKSPTLLLCAFGSRAVRT